MFAAMKKVIPSMQPPMQEAMQTFMRNSLRRSKQMALSKEELLLQWCKKGDLQNDIMTMAAWIKEIKPLDFLNESKLTNVSIGGNKFTVERMVYLLVLLCVYASDDERSEAIRKVEGINLVALNRGDYILRLNPKILNAIQFNNLKEVKQFTSITIELLKKDKDFKKLISKAISKYEKAEKTEFCPNDLESFGRSLLRRSFRL